MPVVVLHSAVMTSVAARVAKACFHLASARAPHTWVAHCTLVALIALTVDSRTVQFTYSQDTPGLSTQFGFPW